MSRSRKKNPIVKDYSRGSTRLYKRMASKAVRRYKGILIDGKHYKKCYPTYNIHDYRFMDFNPESDWYTQFKRK